MLFAFGPPLTGSEGRAELWDASSRRPIGPPLEVSDDGFPA